MGKIADNQSKENTLKFGKVLIAISRNLTTASEKFRGKIKDYDEYNKELAHILKLDCNKNKYAYDKKREKFI